MAWKAWGTGLSFSSRRFELSLGQGPGRLLEATEMAGDDDPASWWFEDLDPHPHFAAAVCWQGEPRVLRCFDFSR